MRIQYLLASAVVAAALTAGSANAQMNQGMNNGTMADQQVKMSKHDKMMHRKMMRKKHMMMMKKKQMMMDKKM